MRNGIWVVGLVGLCCSGCTITPQAYRSNTYPEIVSEPPVGKLAFVTSDNFGSPGTISILGHPASQFQGGNPEFSVNGTAIVYDNYDGTNISRSGLLIRDIVKNVSHQIDNRSQNADSPSLSADGYKLLYVVWSMDRQCAHIYISDADGSHWMPLTTGSYYNWRPRWSPDGKRILFESTRDGQRQIYVMDANGQNQRNVTHDKVLNHAPSWSPDGSQIAFMSRGENNKANIFTMKIDGSDRKNISKGTTRDSEPVWPQDGKYIAFTRTVNNPLGVETMDIWIMKNDGTDQRQITRNKEKFASYQPSWGR